MSKLSINDVADRSAEALCQRGARDQRSLQGEPMAIIERALQESPTDAHASAAKTHLASLA